MKIQIEINYIEDGRVFLNFWNYMNGHDVVAEILEGKLYQDGIKITLNEFITKVKNAL